MCYSDEYLNGVDLWIQDKFKVIKCFVHYHKGWISIQATLLKGSQYHSSYVISIWIWPLWTKRSYTIWLLLRSGVLSTHLKTNAIYYTKRSSHGLTLPLKTLYQHKTEIALVQRQRTLCKGINSLDLDLSLTGASPMKLMLNGWRPGPEPLRKLLTFNQNTMNYLFFSGILFDMDCFCCVHSAFRLEVVGVRTQRLYHQSRPTERE